MDYLIERDAAQIDDVLNKCVEMEGVSKWAGMTFEQGVQAGIEWVLGLTEDHPMEDA